VTMQINAGDKIGGLPILEVRDLLRRFPLGFHSMTLERAGYSGYRAKKLIRALLIVGYLEASADGHLRLTPAGKTFSGGSAAKRVRWETADAALKEFMERVERANRNQGFLMTITAAVVFGSYLRGGERIGDLDLAIELEPKKTPKDSIALHKMYADHFEKSGRAYRYVGCEYDWAQREVLLFLKNRKRTLSLHTMSDFAAMDKTPDFSYKILLGDPERISAKLRPHDDNDRPTP